MEILRIVSKLTLYTVIMFIIINFNGETLVVYKSGGNFNEYGLVDITFITYVLMAYLLSNIGYEVAKLRETGEANGRK